MNTPTYWEEAQKHLSTADDVMAGLIETYAGEMLQSRGAPFETLARAIVGQQISVKAAASVWQKFETGVGGQVAPALVDDCGEDVLRSFGLSRQKVKYLKALSVAAQDGYITSERLAAMDDHEAIKHLTELPGIGQWTAEMFLMFCLMRPDVWPVDDVGLIKAVQVNYKLERPGKKELKEFGETFRPYRSVATWYLWRSLDPVPVAY